MPGRWWYLPVILLLGVIGLTTTVTSVNAVARYATGLVGGLAAAWVFVRHARESTGFQRRLLLLVGVELTCFAVAAGAIVPRAPFWPASVFNYPWFARVAGVPIQFVRGVLACCIALSIWGIWKRVLAVEVSSKSYMAHVQAMFARTLLATVVILVGGWSLTEFLGDVRMRNMREESLSDINLLGSRFDAEMASLDRMVKALAESPSVLPLLQGGGAPGDGLADSLLQMGVAGSGADEGYIVDRSGMAVDASGTEKAVQGRAPESAIAPYLRQSLAGVPGYHIVFDVATGSRDYYASYPIGVDNGSVAGVAVLKKSLDAFATDLNGIDRTFFLVDPDGRIMLTNRTGPALQPLWPLSPSRQPSTHRAADLAQTALLEGEIADGTWVNIDGERRYVRRRFGAHGQWSLVLMMPSSGVFASRVLGIIITLLVTIMVLIYLYLKDRSMRDNIELERRLSLQAVAHDLRLRASTDPLTELFNRLRFDEALAEAIERAQRYNMPFSLVLYDVDHFKWVNDTHGHQVGDAVLVRLSHLVSHAVRAPDLVARWGGEEFVILAPGADGLMARQAAERLRMTIQQTVFDVVGSVTCSFGVAQYVPGDTAQTVLARADRALYRAKIGGRNRVEFDSDAPPRLSANLA
jgi:diguanylate cyclase (GGDEF)-like protein